MVAPSAFNLSNLDSLLLKTFTEPYRLQFHLSFQLENTHAQTDFCLALATASLPRLGHTQVTLETSNLREQSGYVARRNSYVLRLDERLVQSESWLRLGWRQ